MSKRKMKNASGKAGVSVAGGGQAAATKQKKTRYCRTNDINKVLREIRRKELQLRSTVTDTQLETLPKVLQHFGARRPRRVGNKILESGDRHRRATPGHDDLHRIHGPPISAAGIC